MHAIIMWYIFAVELMMMCHLVGARVHGPYIQGVRVKDEHEG